MSEVLRPNIFPRRLEDRGPRTGGPYTPPGEGELRPDVFTGRPVTHSAVSPSKGHVAPKLHADPCLQPLVNPPAAQGATMLSFMNSVASELEIEAKLVNETRGKYQSIMDEQRRKTSFATGGLRCSTDSSELIELTRQSPRSNFGLPSPLPSPSNAPSALRRASRTPTPTRFKAVPPPRRPSQQDDPPLHRPNPPSRPSSLSDRGSDSGLESPNVNEKGKKKKGGKRRHLHVKGRIKVCVRKRPLNAAGQEGGADVVSTLEKAVIVQEHKERIDLSKYTEKQTFHFDEVFDEDSINQDVYLSTAKPLLDTFFEGGNASCFAYGQTGSGKTHTMLGNGGEPGLYLLAARELFNRLGPSQTVVASFYEIYCNTLYDLLGERRVLFPREDAYRKVNIVGLSEHGVTDFDSLVKLMGVAEKQRSSGATAANEQSSRSHAILSLTMYDEQDPAFEAGFKFIDLAGSERGADTAERGRKTQQEGAEINKSLLALKECIRGLDLGHQHIKFRGSKLTEVLRDSFTGNCRTVMIATLSPSSQNVEHSLNTLRYANRVKGLPSKSVDPSKARNVRRRSTSAGVQQPTPNPEGAAPAKTTPTGRPKPGKKPKPRSRSVPSRPVDLAPDGPMEDDESDGLDDLDLSPAALLAVRGKLERQRRQNAALQDEVTRLRKQLRDKEIAHKQEIGMCKMVKKMDEQRVTLLEDHNTSLQKKIQELSQG
eukprot:TRINITY_DN15944_c0_g1_i1.p1 TRINITY_DN15944_c0_g1~~TRINITY_DN15944_c0_g1_i1.p1  ORF type:complete len:712 (+),score=139.49 TRINITY_DN15944_c0_g1_i1:18-2153(+)